jgi:hypothetical protein
MVDTKYYKWLVPALWLSRWKGHHKGNHKKLLCLHTSDIWNASRKIKNCLECISMSKKKTAFGVLTYFESRCNWNGLHLSKHNWQPPATLASKMYRSKRETAPLSPIHQASGWCNGTNVHSSGETWIPEGPSATSSPMRKDVPWFQIMCKIYTKKRVLKNVINFYKK